MTDAGADTIVLEGDYQLVHVDHVDQIDLKAFANGDYYADIKVGDDDGNVLFRIERADDE